MRRDRKLPSPLSLHLSFSALAAVLPLFLLGAVVRAQDLFTGSRGSASIGVGGADLAAPQGLLGAVTGNPAGIASLEGRSVEIGGLAIFGKGRYVSPTDSNGRLDPLLGAAPAGAVAARLGQSPWRVSLSATPDTSLSASWHYNDAPGTASVSYGRQRNQSSLLNERVAFAVARPLGRRVQLGGSFGVVYNRTTLIAPTIFQRQPVLTGLKTLLTLHTSGVGWNGSAGMIVTALPSLQLGLSYKSPTSLEGTGSADGNLSALLAALNLTGSFRPDFHYDARLKNTLPQTAGVGVAWQARPRLRFFLRADFVNWKNSFDHLSLAVSRGDNADLNGLVGAAAFDDRIPLNWRNQGIFHAGVEASATRHLTLRAGYVAGNNPVPGSTLTPLTAAITQQTVAGGVGYRRGRYVLDAGYQAGLPATARVTTSALRAGEYNNSSTSLTTHTISSTLSMSF